MRDHVVFYLNGERREVRGEEAFMPLSSWLRYERAMTGTKVVCAEGDCGACTVLLSHAPFNGNSKDAKFEMVNSCIYPVALLDGAHVVTVDGLAKDGALSAVQEKMVECAGSQCGFCTPGFVMALTGMFEEHDEVDRKTAQNHLTGNLCRCTGYEPILTAATQVKQPRRQSERFLDQQSVGELGQIKKSSFRIRSELGFHQREFFGPATLDEAIQEKRKNPRLRLIGSATDLGVQVNKEKIAYEAVMSLHNVAEMHELKLDGTTVHVGARVTLTQLRKFLENRIPEFARFLDIFASPQIKNAATLIGNIANASPIGDTIPFLMVAEAVLHIAGPQGRREVPITSFYHGYKKMDLKPDEILTGVEIPVPNSKTLLKLYKVSQRKDLDISTVNSGFFLNFEGGVVCDVRLCYGGVGPTAMRLPKTEALLKGRKLDARTLQDTLKSIETEITPLSDFRGSEEFRRKVAVNLFRKFVQETGLQAEGQV